MIKKLSLILACAVAVVTLQIFIAYLMEDPCETQSTLHTQINWDNRFFSRCRDRVYVADEDHDYFPLLGHDAASFKVLPFFYAKDKYHVYYVAHGDDLLGGTEVRILPGAFPATFEVVDAHTAKDSKHTYYFPYSPSSDSETNVKVTDNNTR